ncbi:hypothetical protein ACWEWG_04455 [Streptomyces sp. NPDC003758]|uniref:Uncharacterized protein n=1 Tax=Streptomyces cynarae TaxID=2981134 RepID=A0ABY6E0R0_9ACTN|nr:hypothetical protein [Streptomyces cynarae]UXY20239.1 hypothetical protein N8I84_17090 [Streptomyces cynarae]
MPVSRLVRAELGRFDWGKLRCGCGGTAEHIPEIFERLVEAESAEETFGAELEGHLEVQGELFEVAVPAVSVILAALADTLCDTSRNYLLAMLGSVVLGEAHPSEAARGRTHLDRECQLRAREGLPLIFREALTGDSEIAVEILEVVDIDDERVDYYRRLAQNRKRKGR